MAKSRRPDLQLSIEKIDASTALLWLDSNTHNRNPSQRLVDIYAEAIAAGEWKLNGEPIIFDYNGRLQSGQHRLMAVVQADLPIESVVVRGAEPDSLFTLDSGRKRKIADVLQLRGEENVTTLGAALSWVWRIKNDKMDMLGETTTNAHLLTILDETPDIRQSVVEGRYIWRHVKLAAGLLAAMHWAMDSIDPEGCQAFWHGVTSGEELKAQDSRLALRKWAFRMNQEPRRPTQIMTAAVIIKAWNAYREMRPVKVLAYKPQEEFPKMVTR